jgi:hypothetical protein
MLGDRVVVTTPTPLLFLEVANDSFDVAFVGRITQRGDGVGDVRINTHEVFGLVHVTLPAGSVYIIPDSCTFAIMQ